MIAQSVVIGKTARTFGLRMDKSLFIILAITVSLTVAGRHDIYARHTVHGIKVRNEADQKILHNLESELDVDIWQHGMPSTRDAMVMVSPENKDAFLTALDDAGVQHYMEVSDVAKLLEEEDENLSKYRQQRSNRMIFQDYPRYAEVEAYMESVAAQYPNLVTLVTAGQSYEGRPVKYLKISTTNFNDTSKPVYFMTAMIHAREWVTTPVTMYSIHRLVEDLRNEDSDLRNDIDWIIMPVVNPDGYEYSHTDVRLWRKTRSINPSSPDCIGADGNRNFAKNWATIGVSTNPCDITFPGTSAFSEPETRYVRDIMLEHLDRIQLFMDIHSFGKYVTFGYGDKTLPSNAFHLHFVGAAMGSAIDAVKLPKAGFYLVGNSALLMYVTSGCAQDYGQSIGIPFSYTLELPSYGYMFSVPPQYVDQINEETWRGIAASARLARSFYSARYRPAQ